jgi:hypothetical protein
MQQGRAGLAAPGQLPLEGGIIKRGDGGKAQERPVPVSKKAEAASLTTCTQLVELCFWMY